MKTELLRGSLVVVLAFTFGCANNGPVRCHKVTGQVKYDGKPAAGVQVYLMPTSAPMVPVIPANPHGVTGPDGRFTISTYGEDDGAPEGGYQVLLVWLPENPERDSDGDRLMGWYDAAHSKLTAHVKEGDNELPVILIPAISRPPGTSEGVPGRN